MEWEAPPVEVGERVVHQLSVRQALEGAGPLELREQTGRMEPGGAGMEL